MQIDLYGVYKTLKGLASRFANFRDIFGGSQRIKTE